ncbi:hypothetical protein ASPACDRAFT_56173 [Aspergillus aculeatus ATCC 16872]|uniref:Uncharacterized protein n=1 Tax=Aspergillus aculeatus (strain ATCC 16872 / CBS 172.66 / WB 5094) TaxID=690307 RepID=A0A1L9X8F9_ASPA1|nr:uncharacterized protein ASPACDRAFT_56173 [Aspergillus aculeatus ATCC 16872]OJK04723.1 hypothetical protein ASPACDRAFT_56173 [Aspergillus aculeatus ATCC 16872]
MQWSTITTILTLLLLNTTQASAFSIARVWASFYSECPADSSETPAPSSPSDDPTTSNTNSILANFFASFFQRTEDQSATVVIDVYSGTCQAFPVGRRYNADAISFNAEAVYTGPYDRCNVTVHEVPGCVDAPLIEVPIQADGSAAATCTEREFHSLSQMWILLHCETDKKSSSSSSSSSSTGTSIGKSSSTTTSSSGSSSGQQKPSQQAQPHGGDHDESQSQSSSSTDPKIPDIPAIPAIPDIPKLQPTIFSKLHAALENVTAATNAGAGKANSTAPVLSRSMRLRRAARTRLSNL